MCTVSRNAAMSSIGLLLFLIIQNRVFAARTRFEKVLSCVNLPNGHYYTAPVQSEIQCAVKCSQDVRCWSFSVHLTQDTRTCYLNNGLISATGCADQQVAHFNTDPICLNDGVYNDVTGTCHCVNSYVGDRCDRLMKDCVDGFQSGHYKNEQKVFTIHPDTSPEPFQVFCEMEFGGELTIMRRHFEDTSVNFKRGWNDYRDGFGVLTNKNWWMGLEKLHWLTSTGRKYILVVSAFVAEVNAKYRQHFYHEFKVSPQNMKYSFTFAAHAHNGFEYNIHDCLSALNGQPFSTIDSDNDNSTRHCANDYTSGWWFKDCSQCNPTGVVQDYSENVISADPSAMSWPVPGNWAIRSMNMFLKI